MKTRLLIIGISVAIIVTVTIGGIMMSNNAQQYEKKCADSYIAMRDKIEEFQKTKFNTVSSYVTELDKILEVKKTIHELQCDSNPSKWIHIVTGTEKILNPPQIVIERSYDVVNEIINHKIVSPRNAVTAKITSELENRGIEYNIVPFNHVQTDEGWGDPTRLCSVLVFPNGTEFFASATFHPTPLNVTGIFTDIDRPKDCQKYFELPRFDQDN